MIHRFLAKIKTIINIEVFNMDIKLSVPFNNKEKNALKEMSDIIDFKYEN